jgi:hypothetical protein
VEHEVCLLVELPEAIEAEAGEVAATSGGDEEGEEHARRDDESVEQRPQIDGAMDDHEDEESVEVFEIVVPNTVAGEVAVMVHDNDAALANRAMMCPKSMRHLAPVTERLLSIVVELLPEVQQLLSLVEPRPLQVPGVAERRRNVGDQKLDARDQPQDEKDNQEAAAGGELRGDVSHENKQFEADLAKQHRQRNLVHPAQSEFRQIATF